MLFQELCRDNLGWDDKLESKTEKKWREWIADLSKVRGISVSRCVYDVPKQEVLECYLHGFGDASNRAYCAVVYFVCHTHDGVYTRLLTTRSRVAPLKVLTIPRLEYSGTYVSKNFGPINEHGKESLKSTGESDRH